jgi:undecaprenyl pyrophosphate phosphatase UppP
VASLVAGLLAIRFMLSYLRTRSLDIFVWYRFALAAVVLVFWLSGR